MIRFVTLTLIAMTVMGCQGGARPDPGMAGLRVKVIAEPKAGVQPPPTSVSTYDLPVNKGYGAFSRIDYAELDNIVVWVEPARPSTTAIAVPSPLNVIVDPQKSSQGIDAVASVGQKIVLHNAGLKPQRIYSVSDGNDFVSSPVPASGTAEYLVRASGLIEIFANSSKDIAVQIMAAPTLWAQITHAGKTIEFNNIPPGRYQIVSWHARLPGTSDAVDLIAGHVTDATIKVGVNSLPKVPSSAAP